MPSGRDGVAAGLTGRSGGIRTHDPLSPRQVRYQTALRSDRGDQVAASVAKGNRDSVAAAIP